MPTYPIAGGSITRLNNTQFALPGDVARNWTRNRSVLATSSDGTVPAGIYVAEATYADGRTVVTTFGTALPAVILAITPGLANLYMPYVPIPDVPITDPAQLEYVLW